MKTLPVDFSDLALALQDQGGELHVYYFDADTGAVLNLSEDIDEAQLHEIREKGSGRFLEIEPMNPRQGYRIMADFVGALPPSRLQEKLEWSLDGPKPFRRFKDALREDEAIRKQWFDFQNARMREFAVEWLADHQIRPKGLDLEDPRFQESVSNESVTRGISEEAGEHEESDQLDAPEVTGAEELFEPLSEEEEAELIEFSESLPEEPLNLAKLHGLFTALAVGPGQVVSLELIGVLAIVCGKLPIKDSEHAKRISALMSRFYSEIIEDLASESFVPHLQPKDAVITDIASDMASWCQGFVLGMEKDRSAWRSWFKDPRREKLISLITRTAAKKSSSQKDKILSLAVVQRRCIRVAQLRGKNHSFGIVRVHRKSMPPNFAVKPPRRYARIGSIGWMHGVSCRYHGNSTPAVRQGPCQEDAARLETVAS